MIHKPGDLTEELKKTADTIESYFNAEFERGNDMHQGLNVTNILLRLPWMSKKSLSFPETLENHLRQKFAKAGWSIEVIGLPLIALKLKLNYF